MGQEEIVRFSFYHNFDKSGTIDTYVQGFVWEKVNSSCCLYFFFSSIFQSVCVLGYCVFPLTVSLILCRLILMVDEQTTVLFAIRFVAVVLGFGWSTFGEYIYTICDGYMIVSSSYLYIR